MARLHYEDIFSPVRFDTSLADSSINSGGSITSTSNIEREICLSFKDAPYEKSVFEFSDDKSVMRKNEIISNIDSFEKTTKSENIFSPVRFDTSLADSSINSGGSITSTSKIEREMCLSFKDDPYEKCVFIASDVKSVERENEMGSSTNSFEKTTKSENSVVPDLSFAPKKDSLMNLVHSKKLTSDLKILNADNRASKENVLVKKNIDVKGNQHGKRDTKQNSGRDSFEIIDGNNKKPARSTSLLSTKGKMVESNSSKYTKKKEKKIIRKSVSAKNASDQDKRESDSSEKNYLNRNISDVGRSITVPNSIDSSLKQTSTKSRIAANLEKDKSKRLQKHLGDSRTSNLPLESENGVIEKMVHDHVSFECDKIRQNMYSNQMSFYRELNKIKDEMEQQHLVTTERLFKIIEELMHLNVLVKEKL